MKVTNVIYAFNMIYDFKNKECILFVNRNVQEIL